MSGYKVSHPKIDCTINAVLCDEQFHQILNLLAEIGEGGKCVRMSDLSDCRDFEWTADFLRDFF